MLDARNGITDVIRDERATLRDRSADWRQRRLQDKVSSLHDELEREREARRALADAIGTTGRGRRGRGLLRILVIGATAYVLGARAGRERYVQMTGWIQGVRDRLTTTARDVQEGAAHTAGQVRDVAIDTARTVGNDVKNTAAQVGADTAEGARRVGDETGDAGRRLKSALTPATDTPDV